MLCARVSGEADGIAQSDRLAAALEDQQSSHANDELVKAIEGTVFVALSSYLIVSHSPVLPLWLQPFLSPTTPWTLSHPSLVRPLAKSLLVISLHTHPSLMCRQRLSCA
jgi:hypothetical protein